VQAIVGSSVALVGAWLVHHWHTAQQMRDAGKSNLLDRGQPVVLEGWANESAGIARVRYRGASWDARVAAGARPETGATLYIDGQDGATLIVVPAPPR
jgi:membrane protein implicated in regulation of membrane protease activity